MLTRLPTLVRDADDDAVYAVEGKSRQLIAKGAMPGMFEVLGVDPADVRTVSERELRAIPLRRGRADIAARIAPAEMLTIDLNSFLGAGHYMTTHGAIYGNGRIDAQTRTRTVTWFGGFRGGVYLVFSDANGIPKGQSQLHTFGVDGTWIGRSDRTDYWTETVSTELAGQVAKIAVFHSWAPHTLKEQVERAMATAQPILELIAQIKKTIGDGKST